jgi:hypothetical protein
MFVCRNVCRRSFGIYLSVCVYVLTHCRYHVPRLNSHRSRFIIKHRNLFCVYLCMHVLIYRLQGVARLDCILTVEGLLQDKNGSGTAPAPVRIHACMHACVHVYTPHICTDTGTQTHVYVYVYIYTHIHTHRDINTKIHSCDPTANKLDANRKSTHNNTCGQIHTSWVLAIIHW